jgi:PPOX class probable F420-dependent enzyme
MVATILGEPARGFVAAARRGTLATMDPDGRPRLVPICFVVGEAGDRLGRAVLYTPIDDKPKVSDDPHALARVRDLLILPEAVVLVDRWDEDWSRLGWVRLYGRGELLEPQPHEREEHGAAAEALRAKYPQYAGHRLDDRPIIRITVDAVRSWGDLGGTVSG